MPIRRNWNSSTGGCSPRSSPTPTPTERKGNIGDELAKKLLAEWLAAEEAETGLKRAYIPRLEKVLPGAKVMRYLQIENKIRAIVRYELAAEIPLVP